MQPVRMAIEREWWDTSGVPEGDYETVMAGVTVTDQASYELAKRTTLDDIETFKAAVGRADVGGELYYNASHGFTTVTAADRKAADRATMLAAGSSL